MFFSFTENRIKKPGLEPKGPLNVIIPSWVEFFFDCYEKGNSEQKRPQGFWAALFKNPVFPWLRLDGKKSHIWAEVLLVEDYTEITVNIAFPFKQHYTTMLSDNQIEIPSNLKVSGFKSGKYLTFKGIVTKAELTKLLMQIFSKAYGCSQDSIIIATLTG
jgi:hypothetical protein